VAAVDAAMGVGDVVEVEDPIAHDGDLTVGQELQQELEATALTRTSASSARGSGRGTSAMRTTSGGPYRSVTAARIPLPGRSVDQTTP